jgi:beta-mannosidase
MGTLLWQLNDCWPVTSWSIIDYSGTPKAAWYAVKRAYAANANNKIDSIDRKKLLANQPVFSIKPNGTHAISITASCDASYVYIYSENDDLKLSDNYFHIKKGETKIIALENVVATKALVKKLKVYSLNAFYFKVG